MAEARDRQVAFWLLGIAVLLGWVVVWVFASVGTPEWLAHRDWIAFDRAAEAFRTGEFAEAYRASARTDLFLLYPPYVLYAFVPLAFLPPTGSYLLVLGSGVVLFLIGWVGLARWLNLDGRRFAGASLAIALSGWWLMYLPTGQLSPIYLFAIVAGGVLWSGGRPALAGVAFALLWVKPNLAIVMLVLLAYSRSWRAASSMLGGLAVLALLSLPLGSDVWEAYRYVAAHLADTIQDGRLPLERQLTLFALLETSLAASRTTKLAIWAVATVPLGLATLAVWRPPIDPARLPRLLGVAALFMVAANPYLFFYDGILLILPAAVLFASAASYRDARTRTAAGVFAFGTYVWLFSLGRLDVPLGWVGVLACAWLLIEAYDLTRDGAAPDAAVLESGSPPGREPATAS